MANTRLLTLLDLPSEILEHVLHNLSTPSFIQTILTCHQLFDVAAASRDVILHHLHQVPGIKLGLEDHALTTTALFLMLRQRAASSLYGANFHADCQDLKFQHGTLDATASCLANSIGDIDISLVMNESHVVRHYNTGGTLESHTPPYIYGDGKPVQVVHWKGTTSVLYERLAPSTLPCSTCVEGSNFHHVASTSSFPSSKFSGADEGQSVDRKTVHRVTHKKYYLVHHKSHLNDHPDLFHIPTPDVVLPTIRGQPTRTLIPLGLAIHNRLKCAILWGEPLKSSSSVRTRYVVNSKSSTTQVILYTCDRLPAFSDEGSDLDAMVLYPIQRPPDEPSGPPSALDRNAEYLAQYRPRSIAFVEGGRHLKLYRAGRIAPYAMLPSTVTTRTGRPSHDQRFSRLKNEVYIGLNSFKIESPFYGQHTFGHPQLGDETEVRECLNVFLHLATLSPGFRPIHELDRSEDAIYIVQNRITTDFDDCEHVIDLDDTGRVPYDELRVVARLWGWDASLLANSTLTAIESVCISSKGTRIAIACWDRLLVWPLHPEIFCEAWVAEERKGSESDEVSVVSDESTPENPPIVPLAVTVENGQADDGNNENSDTASSVSDTDNDIPTQPAMVKATKFYDLVRHPSFGEIVELRPIVLKLPGGAIARKLMWSSASNGCFDEQAIGAAEDLTGMSDNDVNRHSVRSDESEMGHSSSRRDATRLEVVSDDTNIPIRLTQERHLDQGPGFTDEEKRELNIIGAELETLVEDTLRLEPSAYSPATGGINTRPAAEKHAGMGDEQLYTGIEETPPLLCGFTDTDVNDGTATSRRSEKARDVLEDFDFDSFLNGTDEGTFVLEGDRADQEPSQQCEKQDGLDLSLLDQTTDVLENFDFDSFLNTTNEEPFTFDDFLNSQPIDSTPDTMLPAPNFPPAPHNLDSRPSSPLEVPNSQRRRPGHNRNHTGQRRHSKRDSEDELVVLTDRGLQVWNLGVWAKGRRERGWLEEKLP